MRILIPTMIFSVASLLVVAAPVPSNIPKFRPGEERSFEVADGVKMKFCWIPAGKATLGSPEDEKYRGSDEKEHEFKCTGFWMGKYPVTQEEYTAIVHEQPSHFNDQSAELRNANITSSSRFPVEQIKLNECRKFAKKLNECIGIVKTFESAGKFRLPKEDEWEYACRGGLGNKKPFYWGDSLNGNNANCDGSDPYGTMDKGAFLRRTSEVGSYARTAPHPWGLCDMLGNVWQWCDDPREDDKGEKIDSMRGGSWIHCASYSRAANRGVRNGDSALYYIGFRVAFIPE